MTVSYGVTLYSGSAGYKAFQVTRFFLSGIPYHTHFWKSWRVSRSVPIRTGTRTFTTVLSFLIWCDSKADFSRLSWLLNEPSLSFPHSNLYYVTVFPWLNAFCLHIDLICLKLPGYHLIMAMTSRENRLVFLGVPVSFLADAILGAQSVDSSSWN